MAYAMNPLTLYTLHSTLYTQYQPPIANWDKLQTAVCLLILLAVGNVVLIVVALFLRRRLNDIEATRPPSRKQRDERKDQQR